MAKARSIFNEVMAEHHARLERIAERRGVTQLKRVYDDAQGEVAHKLQQLVRGRRGDTFDAHQKRLVLAQLTHGQQYVIDRLGGELSEAARDARHDSLRALARDVRRLDRAFGGDAPVLPIEDAARFQGVIDKRETSVMKRHETSLARYGKRLVKAMESELAKSLLEGEAPSQTIDRIVEVADVEWWQGERIVRCLPGDTLITGGVVGTVYRRWFEGDLVEVVTERGRKLAATANHPMLTRRGWVAQGQIVPGDYLVCDARHQNARTSRDQHIARSPATIAEVFDTSAAVGIRDRRRGRQPDFHGDGIESEIDIARPKRLLVYGVFSELTQPACEQFFALPDESTCRKLFCSRCLRLLPHERACLCQRANSNSMCPETPEYHAMIDTIRCGDLRTALTGLVSALKLINGQVESIPGATVADSTNRSCLRLCAHPNASFSQETPHGRRRTFQMNTDLSRTDTVTIELDRVVNVRLRSFASHVFNISTPSGYFVANGMFTGNTELAWAANATHADGLKDARQVLPDLMMQWRELCDDRGNPLDNRVGVDSMAMHLQVAEPGEVFICPARAPNGEEVSDSLVYEEVLIPPLRPNGRETLTPWRPGWGPAWRFVGGRRVPMR